MKSRDQSVTQLIAGLAVSTGIAPRELIATHPMVLDEMTRILSRKRHQ